MICDGSACHLIEPRHFSALVLFDVEVTRGFDEDLGRNVFGVFAVAHLEEDELVKLLHISLVYRAYCSLARLCGLRLHRPAGRWCRVRGHPSVYGSCGLL